MSDHLLQPRRIISTAEHAEAGILLLAGDIFDHNRAPQWLLDGMRDVLSTSRLHTVMLPGNHDPDAAGESRPASAGLGTPSRRRACGARARARLVLRLA